jgi:hypothetical protein
MGLVGASGASTVQARFITQCGFSHTSHDDPIVFPGVLGATHQHDFFGNVSTAYDSTLASLTAAGTSCVNTADTAAYWVPALLRSGVPLTPGNILVYYSALTYSTFSGVQTIPAGLKMLAGDSHATSPQPLSVVGWKCGRTGAPSAFTATLPDCRPLNLPLIGVVRFPSCWDGVHLDSPDHMSHMAYAANGGCPADHPVELPDVRYGVNYGPNLDPATLALSSGGQDSLHGDFWNSWQQPALDHFVAVCIDAGVDCGHI